MIYNNQNTNIFISYKVFHKVLIPEEHIYTFQNYLHKLTMLVTHKLIQPSWRAWI